MSLGVLLALASSASAQPVPASVGIVRAECEPPLVDGARLLDHLRIELGADGVETVEDGASPGLLAILRLDGCDPAALVATAEDPLTRKTVQRPISLAEVSERARPRTLALLLAELLRASWAELALAAEPATEVPAAVRAALGRRVEAAARVLAVPPATPEPRRRLAIDLAPEVRLLTDPVAIGWGARSDVAIAIGQSALQLGAGAGFRYAGTSVDLGTIDVFEAALRGGLGIEIAGDSLSLFTGGWLDAGLAFIDAEARDASVIAEDAVRFVLAVGATVGMRLLLADGFGLMTAVDLAIALVGSRANVGGDSELGNTGFSTGFRLGVFFAL
jgi:hypothetical protein